MMILVAVLIGVVALAGFDIYLLENKLADTKDQLEVEIEKYERIIDLFSQRD